MLCFYFEYSRLIFAREVFTSELASVHAAPSVCVLSKFGLLFEMMKLTLFCRSPRLKHAFFHEMFSIFFRVDSLYKK